MQFFSDLIIGQNHSCVTSPAPSSLPPEIIELERLPLSVALRPQEVAGGRRGATCQSSSTAGASSFLACSSSATSPSAMGNAAPIGTFMR